MVVVVAINNAFERRSGEFFVDVKDVYGERFERPQRCTAHLRLVAVPGVQRLQRRLDASV